MEIDPVGMVGQQLKAGEIAGSYYLYLPDRGFETTEACSFRVSDGMVGDVEYGYQWDQLALEIVPVKSENRVIDFRLRAETKTVRQRKISYVCSGQVYVHNFKNMIDREQNYTALWCNVVRLRGNFKNKVVHPLFSSRSVKKSRATQ